LPELYATVEELIIKLEKLAERAPAFQYLKTASGLLATVASSPSTQFCWIHATLLIPGLSTFEVMGLQLQKVT
jgi:hypothetical protein